MRAVLLAVLFLVADSAAFADCVPGKVYLRGDWGKAGFAVEVVDTDRTRAKGLMNREYLPRFSGMLFVYEEPHRARFWMKNTLIPLDMLFIDSLGVITNIHEMAKPLSEAVIDGGEGVLAVLEINGGLANTLGIAAGSHIQHGAFGTSAAWPCE